MSKNTSIATLLESLIFYATVKLYLSEEDALVARNKLLELFSLDAPGEKTEVLGDLQSEILNPLVNHAVEKGITSEEERLLFESKLMGMVTPCPSAVIAEFDHIFAREGVDAATDYLREISVNSNYIRMEDIEKNIKWTAPGELGDLIITINLAKPEKDAKTIERERLDQSSYPTCMLCTSNMGFAGTQTRPARHALRIIPLFLNDEKWYLQYSPYVYYKDHIIVLTAEHRPMVISPDTFVELLDFVGIFPHFFCGSNAELPIVGGSILSHEHFQGGAKVLPMFKRAARSEFKHKDFSNTKIQILDWYNSVVRLCSDDNEELANCAGYFLDFWRGYSDESVNILASTKKEKHNTFTPIASVRNKEYVLDLILRNNRTDEAHPHGIFHPTKDMHHIKKEGIGLIEAMGLFILPGRLSQEMKRIAQILQGKAPLDFKALSADAMLEKHFHMIAQLANDNGCDLTTEESHRAITEYINNVCRKILECTAVFKNTKEGQDAFRLFMNKAGCKPVKQMSN
ncbi:MAG: galactose-1-phosphate uridylyltransferase [Christensenellales bacterium]|jgi:UDPglucose--hexose-1-phosphate uridylyltransferase